MTSAHSASDLVDLLARRLSEPLADPFLPDVVVVPGQGMVDWLQENLSPRIGAGAIVANVHFWHPNEFNLNATGLHSVVDAPWDPSRLQWTILELLDARLAGGEELVPGFARATRRLAFARRVAELFGSYAVHRPEMILEWAAEKETDGADPIDDAQKWQPRLWLELRSVIGESAPETAQRLSGPGDPVHPLLAGGRLTFFGLESFSRSKIDLVRALGSTRDIAIFHVTPVADAVRRVRDTGVIVSPFRRDHDFARTTRHPLLSSWSRSAWESAALISTVAGDVEFVHPESRTTVLGSLQRALSADVAPRSADVETALSCDGSIQIHRCHGSTRQVEVLRDAILHLLDEDPTLTPRDVLVLCPDLERFAPIIEPIMCSRMGQNGPRLGVAVVDRTNSTLSPVSVAVDSVLALVGGRCSALEVVETLSLEPVRRRFGLEESEVALVARWVGELNIKWGIDGEARTRWGYPRSHEEGTWQWAVDRLAGGMLVQSDATAETMPGIATHDDLSGADFTTIGKLHAFHSRLASLDADGHDERTLDGWASVVGRVLDGFVEVDDEGAEHVLSFRGLINDMRSSAAAAPNARFSVRELRDFLSTAVPVVRGRAMKWNDVVRFGSPSRFRGVPARVVAILGFDEDAFKGARAAGDDILAREPRLGERDGRADERLGLLTVIHSARDCLLITSDGHDVNDNSEIPVPVALGELCEAVSGAVAAMPAEYRGSRALVINHSRQAADPVNVGLGSDDGTKNVGDFVEGPWTFDPSVASVVGKFSAGTGSASSSGLGNPVLPVPEASDHLRESTIDELERWLTRPSELFVRQRLGVVMPKDDAVVDTEISLWPNSLDLGSIGREMLDAALEGASPADWWATRTLRGGLPLGDTSNALLAEVRGNVDALVEAAAPLRAGTERLVDVSVPIVGASGEPAGTTVAGRIRTRDDRVVSVNYSKWNPRMRIRPWLEIALLTTTRPDIEWICHVVARNDETGSKKNAPPPAPVKTVEFRLKGATSAERLESARKVLDFAGAVRRTALRVPVPLFERSSWTAGAAKSTTETQLGYDLDRPAHRLVYGDADLSDLRAVELIEGVDLPSSGASRFDAYAGLLVSVWSETVVETDGAPPDPESST